MEHVREIAALASENQVRTGVRLQGRFAPVFLKVKEVLASGQYGKVVSLYPTLGVDTILPQFRLDNRLLENVSASDTFPLVRPAQNEYPVWYFFYGTLADASILSRIISLREEQNSIKYKRACVRRGRLSTLNEKYLGLMDADEHSKVDGWAYQVQNQSEEDSLRVYETGKYKVVRCTIELMDEQGIFIQGLTFRLA